MFGIADFARLTARSTPALSCLTRDNQTRSLSTYRPRLAATIVVLLAVPGAGCHRSSAAGEPGLDPQQGAILLSAHGCGGCHTIPGVSGADGTIGPPLTGFARRAYVAGKLPNHLSNLMRWIRDPQSIEPGTAMPSLPVNEAEARAMAAYLYTLQ